MNCKQCGNPLQEKTAFCPICGAKQDISTQPIQSQSYYTTPQKPLKNPTVSVILNLIAVFISFSVGLYSVFSDQPKLCSNFLFHLLILIPLLLSVTVLLVKNNTIKSICSIIELVISIFITFGCTVTLFKFHFLLLLPLAGAILSIVASSYNWTAAALDPGGSPAHGCGFR